MLFHVVVSVYRLVKFETCPSSLLNFGTANYLATNGEHAYKFLLEHGIKLV